MIATPTVAGLSSFHEFLDGHSRIAQDVSEGSFVGFASTTTWKTILNFGTI